ncbi:MAG: extracellular solute-binding protein [Chlamydiota bacterium]
MKKTLLRLFITSCWLMGIFLALYWPRINFFSYKDNTINVFAWSDILHPDIVAKFEKETGIKVKFNYYSSNEELLVKLKATKGEGYDLIIPSDYVLEHLIQDNLLKDIDKSKLPFWNTINPHLLNHSFDPNNLYSIPFEWEVFLFVVNKDYFQKHPALPSWKLIFDQSSIGYKIAMSNDPIEATLFASFYLFGPTTSLTPSQITQVQDLLIEQRKWVEVYASFRGDYFLSTGSCQLAIASSSYLWRTLKLFPSIGFMIPKEGTFITLESLAIPRLSKKEALTYQLINYLFQEESVRAHFESFAYFPSTLNSIPNLQLNPDVKRLLFSSEEEFKNFYFMHEVMSQQKITDVWVEVKSKN